MYAYVCLIELSVKYKFSVKKYEHKMKDLLMMGSDKYMFFICETIMFGFLYSPELAG